MRIELFIVLFYTHTLTLINASVWSGEKTRIRVLRSEEEKRKYLNDSRVAKENFFFGMRPILYVSRYCNCPNSDPTVTNVQPGSASSGSIIQDHLEPPEFPPEEFDEVIPPSSEPQVMPQSPRVTESQTNPPPSSSQAEKGKLLES